MPGRVEFTAISLSAGSQVLVYIFEVKIKGQHQHQDEVQQLAHLRGGLFLGLVLRGHPHLGSFLNDLLADLVHAGAHPGNRRGFRVVTGNFCRELSKEAVEGLWQGHGGSLVSRAGFMSAEPVEARLRQAQLSIR